MKRLSGIVLCSVVAVLLVSTQAGSAKTQPARVKYTPSPILTLAQDGSRVAYISGRRVYVWNVATGAASPIKGAYTSAPRAGENPGWPLTSIDHQVAIAGTRVAFVTRFAFDWFEETQGELYVARVGGSAHRLGAGVSTYVHMGPGVTSGDLIAGPVGSGDLLAVSTWKMDNGAYYDEALQLITPAGLQTIAVGRDAIMAESASNGRIAVLIPSWNVRIYSSAGALLRELDPGSPREIALSGNQLVVLTRTNTVEVYDWATGDLLHTWATAKVPPNAVPAHLTVFGRLAVYAIDAGYEASRTLRVLDLETGRDVAVVRARGGGHPGWDGGYTSHDAALGARGLTYVVTYTPRDHPRQVRGKLVFVPTANLLARVS